MAVLINNGHVATDGGKAWKHLDYSCPLLLERAERGFPILRRKNVDHKKPLELHERRRCPVCFKEGGRLRDIPEPQWLIHARELQAESVASAWVYDLRHPTEKITQVGMATNLYTRLRSRFKATCSARFTMADGIPWYYDLLAADPNAELILNATSFKSRGAALQAEATLRKQLSESGWGVTSDV